MEQEPTSSDLPNGDGGAEPERPLREYLVRELMSVLSDRETLPEGDRPAEPLEAEALLRDALREGATDIHLDAKVDGVMVRLRVDGLVHDGAFLPGQIGAHLANQVKIMANFNPGARFFPEEGRITREVDSTELDLRVARAPCLRGEKMSIRVFAPRQPTMRLDLLGLEEPAMEDPTGSGKTTTLYALLHRLRLHERNVVTIEDPVEYQINGINQIQVDLKHGLDYPEGVKAMLRMDPDHVMVGEIRDAASAHAAISAATSGRALMSTVHCRDAVGAVDALRNFGLSAGEISANVMLVVAQRLVRLLCNHCRALSPLDREAAGWLASLGRELPEQAGRAVGCEHCHGLGYRGRTGVFEVWRIDAEEYEMVLGGVDRRTLYRHLRKRGHRFLLDNGLKKAAQGLTTIGELRVLSGYGVLRALDQPG
jgi:type II secretory ATPase GspE/PulE/Tfp pilus assembly ATPase PilB-like protein